MIRAPSLLFLLEPSGQIEPDSITDGNRYGFDYGIDI